jgi:hypothetical protein
VFDDAKVQVLGKGGITRFKVGMTKIKEGRMDGSKYGEKEGFL